MAIDFRQLDTAEQLRTLADHRIDVGFIRAAQPVAGVTITTITQEPLIALLPSDHPLASLAEVPLAALAAEPFVLWPRHVSVGFYVELIGACRHLGFSPHVRFECRGAETLLALIAAGLGVSVQPEPYRNLARTGIAFRRLTGDAPSTALQTAIRRSDASPILHLFLATLDESIQTSHSPAG